MTIWIIRRVSLLRLNIASKIITLTFSLVLMTSIILGVFSYFKQQEEIIQSVEIEKENEVKILSEHIKSKIEELRNDVLFLSSTPPIKGILRSHKNGGIDPLDGSHLKTWKKRLATIFSEMLYAKENYLQIRYIGTAEKGKELVRVERAESSKIINVTDFDLQQKEDETYFKETFELPPHKIYLSEFNPNKEFGKIQYPIQLVLRAAVPIYETRAKPFGLVIINIDYTRIFKSFERFLEEQHEYFVADKNGNILLHSDSSYQSFLSDGTTKKVWNFFPSLKEKYSRKKDLSTIHIDKEGSNKLVVANKIHYNPYNYNDILTLYLVFDKDKILVEAKEKTRQFLFLISFLILFAVILAFFFAKGLTRSFRLLTDFAHQIAQGKVGTSLSIESKDEIGVLAKSLSTLSQELNLKDLELKYQQEALDASAIVVETDSHGKITYVNDKFLEISQYSREELIGNDHRIINSGHHSKTFFKGMWETIKSGTVWHGEILNKAKDQSYYWVDTTIYPVKNSRHKIEKFVAIRFEITEKKQVLEKLEQAEHEARIALQDKTAFFANMSHEIRTPLNGIIGFTDLILHEKLSPEVQEQVTYIKDCSHSLLMIVNDILDLSKIEAGKLTIEEGPVQLFEIVQSTLQIFKLQLDQKKLELEFHYDDKIPQYILSDALRIKQILINLIGNAIKFTKQGKVIVKVHQQNIKQEDLDLIFSIQDTGIGISKTAQKNIFDPYSQVDISTTRKYGGTGLGLSITKTLIELMGGKIWVKSQEGEGTTFYFTLKTANVEHKALVQIEEKSTQDIDHAATPIKKILIAEDNKLNQTLIRAVLMKLGYTDILIVENGKEAIEVIQEKQECFDFILMDVQMPLMDGLEATKYIRNKLILNYYPIIIGLSANAFAEDIEKGLKAGMDYYLEKPLDSKKIAKLLQEKGHNPAA